MLFGAGSGDLSSSLNMRTQIANIRNQVSLSGQKIASGEKSDTDLANEGIVGSLYSIDKELRNINRYEATIDQARTRFDAVQISLENIRLAASNVTLGVLTSVDGGSVTSSLISAETANGTLGSIVSILNQSVSGQSLFSGSALSNAALVDANQIVSDIEVLINGATDVAMSMASVDFYFDDPTGGFATSAYLGSSVDAPSLEVSSNNILAQDVRADSSEIRETIKNLALIAAISNGAAPSDGDQLGVLKTAANRGLQTNEEMVKLQQKVGSAEEAIERAGTQLSVQKDLIEANRNSISTIDLFAEVSLFEELQTQLETSYQVLVRLSSLSLSNFLR